MGWDVCVGGRDFIVRCELSEKFSIPSGRGVGSIDPDEVAVMRESFQHFARLVPLSGTLASLVLHVHIVTRDEWLELLGTVAQVFTFCIVSPHKALLPQLGSSCPVTANVQLL